MFDSILKTYYIKYPIQISKVNQRDQFQKKFES